MENVKAMVSCDNISQSSCYPAMDHKQQHAGVNHYYVNNCENNYLNSMMTSNEIKNVGDVTHNLRDTLDQNNELNSFPGTSNSSNGSQSKSFKSDVPPPPKRPLTPYMRFSKCMWQQVKSDNPGLSVCEIGSTIGRMWRELSTQEKQKHNDDFTLDKVRYDSELKQYLKNTGLKSRDLVKLRGKNKTTNKGSRRLTCSQTLLKVGSQEPSSPEAHNANLGQAFFPLGTPFSMPMGMLSGFSQMWLRQQYPSQQWLASMHLTQPQDLHGSDVLHSSLLTPGINLPSPDHF